MCRRKNKNRRRRAKQSAKSRLQRRSALKKFFAKLRFTIDAARVTQANAPHQMQEASKALAACAELLIPTLRVITSKINKSAEQIAVAFGMVRERVFERVTIKGVVTPKGVKQCNLETKS